ncbi:MAG: hypothetical protein J6Y26_06465 [Lachnospiraceae bacterium]|nr:hypothetical protein [Lachnospiraceae bacterium]
MSTFTGADKAIGFLFDMVANMAEDYNSASTYAADAYAIYSGTLYKCISAISTPEDFTPAHWQAVLIMDEVAAGGGGGGGGTTVIANPAGTATDTLNKLQVGATIYDVPSGGGSSGHTYSTTEHAVGVWIDGSTIWEKTIATGPIAANTNNFLKTLGLSNVKLVIDYNVVIYVPSGAAVKLPYALLTQQNTQQYGCAQQGYNKTTDEFRIDTGQYRSVDECYITIQFTHTTS